MKKKKYLKVFILFWCFFIGIGACGGSMMFFLDPAGGFIMDGMLKTMHDRLPLGDLLFSNLIFSGIALLIVNGISNISAAILIIKEKKIGYILGFVFGITLMLWISIQFYVFAPAIYAIDVFYFIFGFLQFICGYVAYVNYNQSLFTFDINDYPDINKDNSNLVLFFSRSGYSKKLAYKKANELKCEIKEITTNESIKGTSGFWWCGRFNFTHVDMPINEIDIDFSKKENIYLYGPVWIFTIASPLKVFLNKYKEELSKTKLHLVLVHFMNKHFYNCDKQVKGIVGCQNVEIIQYTSHFGNYKKIL